MNQRVIMTAHRSGYATDQIDDTMTVGQLIELLEQFDSEALIYTSHDNGYTFGGISDDDFEEEEDYDN